MENTIYYTFSTIPQVLAGAIALLGAFWIYKVDSIIRDYVPLGRAILRELGLSVLGDIKWDDTIKNKYLERYKEKLETEKGYKPGKIQEEIDRLPFRMYSSIDQRDIKWIEEKIKLINELVDNEVTRKVNQKSEDYLTAKRSLTKNTKLSLYISGGTIFFSVCVLPFTEIIKYDLSLVIVLFLGGIVSFGFSIYQIIQTIVTALK